MVCGIPTATELGTSKHCTPTLNTPTLTQLDDLLSLTPSYALTLCSLPWHTAAAVWLLLLFWLKSELFLNNNDYYCYSGFNGLRCFKVIPGILSYWLFLKRIMLVVSSMSFFLFLFFFLLFYICYGWVQGWGL